MKRISTVLLLFLLSFIASAQNLEIFTEDFENALGKNFSENELNDMFQEHAQYLTPHSGMTGFRNKLKGSETIDFPLAEFSKQSLYKDNIEIIIKSRNPNHRILAYLLLASSGDTNYNSLLLDRIFDEEEKGCRIWAGMALLYLKCNNTTAIFDFLVEDENFGDPHMLPLFITLNPDSLQQTAYNRIKSENDKAKVLAAQILSITSLNEKTEQVLKQAVVEWGFHLKGYALYSISELRIGDLLEILKPLLDSTKTRPLAMQALANSPSKKDRQYIQKLSEMEDMLSQELLNSLFESGREEDLRKWLELIASNKVPEDYYFNVRSNNLLKSDEFLGDLLNTIGKSKYPNIVSSLIMALEGRSNDHSKDLLVAMLFNEDSSIRYWAAKSMTNIHSDEFLEIIPELLSNSSKRTSALTELAIINNIDTLQKLFEEIYYSDPQLEWERSSIEYLTHFPKPRHSELFKKILQDGSQDFSVRQDAAFGLVRLNKENADDIIIEVCEKIRLTESEYNTSVYLEALHMIKSDKSKKYLESYLNSDEDFIKKQVSGYLNNW
jgi:HEAT repeat protein